MLRRGVPVLALLATLVAAPAGGDWLVTRDGDRIETAGAWQVKGKLVVFTRPNGSLASLQLAEVDLAASEAATIEAREAAQAAEAAEPAAPVKKKPVLVLTDADVRPADPALLDRLRAGEGEGEPAAAGEETEAVPGQRVEIASWEPVEDPATFGVTLAGQVRNASQEAAANIRLRVRLFDLDGEQLGEEPAELSATTLLPGQRASFRVAFPDIGTYYAVKFYPESMALATETPATGTPVPGAAPQAEGEGGR